MLLAISTIFIKSEFGADLVNFFGPLVMIAAVFAAGRRRRDFYIAFVLAIPTASVGILMQLGAGMTVLVIAEVIGIAFLAFVVWSILSGVLTSKRVTVDTIFGAICGYLMIGLTFAAIYALLVAIDPTSLRFLEPLEAANLRLLEERRFFRLIYYSFVTITTTGYGDINPISPAAQLFSVIEAMIGQFYIAILIARLVAIELIQSMGAGL